MVAASLAPAALALVLATPLTAAASGQGNSSYQGTFSSTDPDAYRPTPQSWSPGDTVTYDFAVTNTSMLPAQLDVDVYAQRITSLDGHDVSSGQPAVSESAVLGGVLAGDPVVRVDTIDQTLLPQQSMQLTESITVPMCGYLLVWSGTPGDAYGNGADTVLNAGATRVAGCAAATPRPTATPRPPRHTATPGSGGRATPSAVPAASPTPSHHARAALPIGSGPDDSGGGAGAPYLPTLGRPGPPGIELGGPLLALVVLLAAGVIGAAVARRNGWMPRLPGGPPRGSSGLA